MGAGLAKLHELSADAQFAAARNLEAHNPTSTRGLSRIFLKAVLPGRRYPAHPGCDRAVTNWRIDGCANRVGPDIALRLAKNAEAHGSVSAKALNFSAEDKDVEADRGRGAH